MSAQLRQVEEEPLAGNPIVLEGELDEHGEIRAPAVRHHAEPITGHGHLHAAPADERIVVGGVAFEHDIVIRERSEEPGQHLRVLSQAAGAGAEGRSFQQHVVMKNR